MRRLITCCVPTCHNNAGHKFPSDETLREKWIFAIRKRHYIENWNPNTSSRICRQHFKESDFIKINRGGDPVIRHRLHSGTIPTIFPWTQSESNNSSSQKIESELTKGKSESMTSTSGNQITMTIGNSIQRDENKDISNWDCRIIRKNSLYLEKILGKLEYVFSLQDFKGRELEERELEEIISTFPPLKPPNQILPLRPPNFRSLGNIET